MIAIGFLALPPFASPHRTCTNPSYSSYSLVLQRLQGLLCSAWISRSPYWKLRNLLLAKAKLNLYNALIKPHILYGLVIWGSTDLCTTQQPLRLLQNNAVRAITGSSIFEHTYSTFLWAA